jgi:hypothetical protein
MSVGEARASWKALPPYCTDGFLIQYHDLDGKAIPQQWRWRNDPSRVSGFAALTAKMLRGRRKYAQPKGSGCFLYYPVVKGLNWRAILADSDQVVAIVEGELKALSLSLAGIPAIGIGGVWNWQNSAKELLPDLVQFAVNRRRILEVFDSDAADNMLAAGAQYALARALLDAGGDPHIIQLPDLQQPEKTGVDDFVRLHPTLKKEKLIEALLNFEDKQYSALCLELHRLNSEYVCNETGHIIRLHGKREEDHWDDGKFRRIVEPGKVKVVRADGSKKLVSLAAEWLQWPKRNTVKGLIYCPMSQTIPIGQTNYIYDEHRRRCLNTWTGWASEPEEDAEGIARYWTRFLDQLFSQTQNETSEETQLREHCRRWFEMWWAYPVQNPSAGKLYSTAVLMGQAGGGKGLLGSMVGWAVYGKHFHEITQIDLTGQFNGSWMECTSLVMGSEITGKGGAGKQRDLSEFLKHLITGETTQIRIKYVPEYYLKNVINLYFTTNYGDSFFLDDDDRRYFCWEIPNVPLSEALGKDWIDKAVEYARSDKGKAALHFHLLNLVIDPEIFDPNGSPPDTPAKQRAKQYSQNSAQCWIEEFCEDPSSKLGPARVGETVWRFEEVFQFFRADHPEYGRPRFLMHWRERFLCVGRAEVPVIEGSQSKPKKKTGLWVRKPNLSSHPLRLPTLDQIKRDYEQQQQKRPPIQRKY